MFVFEMFNRYIKCMCFNKYVCIHVHNNTVSEWVSGEDGGESGIDHS